LTHPGFLKKNLVGQLFWRGTFYFGLDDERFNIFLLTLVPVRVSCASH
jgi:hypothetical protein